jgi:hypothetical protein
MISVHSIFKTRLHKPVFFIPLAFGFAAFALVAVLTTLPACDKAPAPALGPTHTVRGRVIALPRPGDPASAFSVFHETITDWLRPDGTKGMNAMIMPFPLAKGVSIDGLAVGDTVEVVVRQYTTGPIPYETLSVKKLPPETSLILPQVGGTKSPEKK